MPKKGELSPTHDAPPSPRPTSSRSEIEAFLETANRLAAADRASRGRLIFALDATMSRQPTWDIACSLQAEMFDAAATVGDLSVQLVYFRGYRETRASRWVGDAKSLRDMMVKIDCRGGRTQIRKVLLHAIREAGKKPLAALVYVGDAMEENVDKLCDLAGQLGLHNVRAFMFHEGRDPVAERAFREIARLTRGAYLPFDPSSAGELRSLLGAVATYAAGGLEALEASGSAPARRLLGDLR
ncbi:MAG: VWA domain-containing protein [Paracoccaceae bacterium]